MIEETITLLKNNGLIEVDDIVVVCKDQPSMLGGILGGAVGALIAESGCQMHIMAANEHRFRIFDVDKKTFDFYNVYGDIDRASVIKAGVGGLIGGKNIVLKRNEGTLKFVAQNKIKKHMQKEELARLANLIKTVYVTAK